MQYSQPPNRSVVVEVEPFDERERKPRDSTSGWTNGQIAIDWLKWFLGFVFQFAWGIYTPEVLGTLNIDAVSSYTCRFMRVGTVCSVSGRLNIDVNAGGAAQVTVALPVPSAFTSAFDCSGVAYSAAVDETAEITANVTGATAVLDWTAVDRNANDWTFNFQYSLITP